jgi:hypothetical protein
VHRFQLAAFNLNYRSGAAIVCLTRIEGLNQPLPPNGTCPSMCRIEPLMPRRHRRDHEAPQRTGALRDRSATRACGAHPASAAAQEG